MMTMPNQLYTAESENITIGVVYPFCTNKEFVKNTNSVSVGARSFLFRRVGLATNGVCVFGALTSVSALFILCRKVETTCGFGLVERISYCRILQQCGSLKWRRKKATMTKSIFGYAFG